VAFVEAVTAFHDPLSITIHDPLHAFDEERYLLIGWSSTNRLLVAHRAEGNEIRLISARRASRRERRTYEEENGR
jgi:uncharacterized DUF497 family protein